MLTLGASPAEVAAARKTKWFEVAQAYLDSLAETPPAEVSAERMRVLSRLITPVT